MESLNILLKRIDGKGYKAYKDIVGSYNFKDYNLNILYVQGDPFASPSLFEIEFSLLKFGFNPMLFNISSRRTAFEDFILRRVYKHLEKRTVKSMGKGGEINIYKPGQEIIKRSSVEIKDENIRIRIYVGLPASGRRILAKETITIVEKDIKNIVEDIKNINSIELENHVKHNENVNMFRNKMAELNIKVFIANGSNLARKSSVDDRPLRDAVKFTSPSSLEKTIILENGFSLTGMAIEEGVTIITGGGFHGKSTLLNAIEKGVYNHIQGDGRDYVITSYDAVKIRAEDGRSVKKVDISAFIDNLPFGKGTEDFTTENASGSTSQAANIIEALELKSKMLLIDEDTSATNFMVRDRKVQELIHKSKEPIIPFITRVRGLYKKNGVSSIVVVGGLGDYFDVADRILMLDSYEVFDVTVEAKEISNKYKENQIEYLDEVVKISNRWLDSIETIRMFNTKKVKTKSRETEHLIIGKNDVDLKSVEQLIEEGQVNFIGELIRKIFVRRDLDKFNLSEILDTYEKRLENESLMELLEIKHGSLAYARKYEIGAAINRIRKNIFR
jgi:predicted ABC-class ATPase